MKCRTWMSFVMLLLDMGVREPLEIFGKALHNTHMDSLHGYVDLWFPGIRAREAILIGKPAGEHRGGRGPGVDAEVTGTWDFPAWNLCGSAGPAFIRLCKTGAQGAGVWRDCSGEGRQGIARAWSRCSSAGPCHSSSAGDRCSAAPAGTCWSTGRSCSSEAESKGEVPFARSPATAQTGRHPSPCLRRMRTRWSRRPCQKHLSRPVYICHYTCIQQRSPFGVAATSDLGVRAGSPWNSYVPLLLIFAHACACTSLHVSHETP